MDTELKVMLPVNIVNEHEERPPVYIKHTVEFTMHNYLDQRREVRMSPPFHVCDAENDLEARVVWYDKEYTKSTYLFYVYVLFLPQDQNKVNGKLCFTIKLGDGLIACIQECSMNQEAVTENGWGLRVVFSKKTMYNLHVPQNSFSPDEVYEVLCAGNKSLTVVSEIYLQVQGNTQKLGNQIAKDLGRLLASKEFSDVTLKVGEMQLVVHKAILSARSPVFNKMFKSNMAETQLGVVEIKDMGFEVLQSLLNYVYTDHVDNIDTMAEEMLVAADKYQLDDLKAKCEDSLTKTLTVENATRILILADLHQAHQLSIQATDFIRRHKQKVMATAGWETAKEDHPKTIIALLIKLC